MPEPMLEAPNLHSLRLAASLDLAAAPQLHESLLKFRGRDAEIDAGGVERAGAQCFQILLAAAAAWMADGTRFRIVTPSAAFGDAARLLGISPGALSLEDVPQ